MVTLHCDLAVTKLARLNAVVKVTGQRCWKKDCMAVPEQPHQTGALCPRQGASCTHGMYSTALPAIIQKSATREQSKTHSGGGCLVRADRTLRISRKLGCGGKEQRLQPERPPLLLPHRRRVTAAEQR